MRNIMIYVDTYINRIKTLKRAFSVLSNVQTNCREKTRFEKYTEMHQARG